MRAVFQLPASMTSVVDAPRAVSSDASPTRPLCAVTRGRDAGGAGGGGEAALHLERGQPDHPIRGEGVGGGGAQGRGSPARGRSSDSARRRRPPLDSFSIDGPAISIPSPSVAADTSRHSSALTSARRNPPMNSNPAITASSRPRRCAVAGGCLKHKGHYQS